VSGVEPFGNLDGQKQKIRDAGWVSRTGIITTYLILRLLVIRGFIANYRSAWLSSLSRVALCQNNARKSTTPPHPIHTPKSRPPSRTHASWRKYRGSLTSAFIHFAHSSRSTAAPPLVKQIIPYRLRYSSTVSLAMPYTRSQSQVLGR